ncbi:alpha/beta fold hydrolase [Streptomyces johnsoniae]|uniref:Alpha/beta hydrolase n=1 Tax=Streptomyces johnsoniae TaxID=3075532 RepID=A0ABU2S327_9ACTN|nr:alpha/beta hydrolase [Streptomyces sp. DSM 41886]MDT0443193.1 alpha/beta hydrolase [Streptomyces sp. DSM 41886]
MNVNVSANADVDAGERIVAVDGAELCVQAFGAPGDPPLLLIAGASESMDWWDDELCALLAAGGRRVIRYDNRDTGRSVFSPMGAPGYDLDDLVADAVGVLDAFGVPRAHVMGFSLGGLLAQRLAVHHAARVGSVTLVGTTPDGPGLSGPPSMDGRQAAAGQPRPLPDWSDPVAVTEYLVTGRQPFAGTRGYDEERLRAVVGRAVARTRSMPTSLVNHWLVDNGTPVRPRLGGVAAPALVVHGTEDPLFPFGDAEALAAAIPGAALLPVEGAGHQVPPRWAWDWFVPAVLRHTASGTGTNVTVGG